MRNLISIGIIAGIIAGVFSQFAGTINVVTWISFLAMASFFAAGGKKEGLIKSVAANLSGVVWAMIMSLVLGAWHFEFAMTIVIFFAVIGMCMQASTKLLSFIPATFIGCGATFGNNFDWKATAIAIIVGGILGILIELGSDLLYKKVFAKGEVVNESVA